MKKIFSILLLMLLISLSSHTQSGADALLGKWMTIQNNLEVEVYKQNNDYKARVLWFDDKDDKTRPMNERRDEKNFDRSLRSRKWIGMEVLHDLKYYPHDNEWDDGKIYDPKSGHEWTSEVWITRNNLLKVKGYWLFKFLSQTETFKRLQ